MALTSVSLSHSLCQEFLTLPFSVVDLALGLMQRQQSRLLLAVNQIPDNKRRPKAIVNNHFKQIASEFGGPPDMLLSNAGGLADRRKIGEGAEEEWLAIFDINIKNVYYVAAAFIAIAKPGTTLINVSSSTGHVSFSLP